MTYMYKRKRFSTNFIPEIFRNRAHLLHLVYKFTFITAFSHIYTCTHTHHTPTNGFFCNKYMNNLRFILQCNEEDDLCRFPSWSKAICGWLRKCRGYWFWSYNCWVFLVAELQGLQMHATIKKYCFK